MITLPSQADIDAATLYANEKTTKTITNAVKGQKVKKWELIRGIWSKNPAAY